MRELTHYFTVVTVPWGRGRARISRSELLGVPVNHGCEIVKVEFLVQRLKKIGHFLTVTKDGILQFWSESFMLTSSFRLYQIQPSHSQQMWVIDMVCLHNMNLVAVASTDQKIEFFDISSHKCARVFTFTDLDSCVLTMNYCRSSVRPLFAVTQTAESSSAPLPFPLKLGQPSNWPVLLWPKGSEHIMVHWSDYHRAVFCYGDTKGNVIIFTSDDVTTGLFNPRVLPRTSKWDNWINVSTRRLLSEKSPMYRSYRLKALHLNWCQQVKFIPQLNLVASCSAIDKSSLVLTVLPSKVPDSLKVSVLNLRKGILCFDYCPDKNVLVTGGYDPLIRLWNPFFSRKPVWMMKGHQTSVTHIVVNSKDSSILLSVSKDKHQELGIIPSDGDSETGGVGRWKQTLMVSDEWSQDVDGSVDSSPCPVRFAADAPGSTPRPRASRILENPLLTSLLISHPQNIRVWDMQDYQCLQSFCGKHFALGHCPITSIYFHKEDNSLICSTYSIGILKGYLETQGPGRAEEKTTTYSTPLCAVLYSKVFKQVVSGCLSGMVSVWEVVTGRRLMEFSVTGDQQVELTAMSLDESEGCLLTGLRDGTVKMWNYSVGECLLTFPKADQLEMGSSIPNVAGGWNTKQEISAGFHKIKPVLLCHHWQTFHTEDVLSMAKYQNQFIATSSYNGDILFWNIGTFRPILNFNASQSPLPLLPKRVKDVNDCVFDSHRPSKPCIEQEKWAYKLHLQPPGLRTRAMVDANLRRNLMSAPPVMRHPRDKEPAKPVPLKKPLSASSLSQSRLSLDRHSTLKEAERKKADFQKKLLLQSNASVEKIWDIKDYCAHSDKQTNHPSEINKFRFLISERIQVSLPNYSPPEEKKVEAGQTISLVPPQLLISWKAHLDSVADILYVDSLQLVISAGQDRDVKAWKLSGDAIGTFGLSVWKRLQDTPMMTDGELNERLKKEGDFFDPNEKTFHLELQEERDLAEALMYQRREQVVLLDLLNGKADTEAKAWARLQKITPMSPWTGKRSPEDIEDTWCKWESKGKQESKVLGAAYKPKERLRSPGLLFTNVQYGCMRHQISPQIYQSLRFNELASTQNPAFKTQKVLDQQSWLTLLVTQRIRKDLGPYRDTVPEHPASSPTTTASSPSSPSLSASGSGLLASGLAPSSWSQPSRSFL
nr:PREDICTED: EF-hand calcium-binding domain-containing protein 8 [Bos mutus]